ncbi:hypothetical protein ANN_03126 [Periplaneta americana]|uniref:Uncharacterized protein n=1 Tax=Periplaneta americana TaxID=6978 RepID=A0ABQ8TZT9_PERAM|nr:hypothetical protein ANN_03126 [Periplaneta americana]
MAGLCEGGNEPPGSLKANRLRNKAVLERVGEERMMLKLIRKRKRNWLGHWLRKSCLQKDVLEGNEIRVRSRRRYEIIDNIGNKGLRQWCQNKRIFLTLTSYAGIKR